MKNLIALLLTSAFVGSVSAQTVVVKPRVTIACKNIETFDGLKMVEQVLGQADLESEIEHVIQTGACQCVYANHRLKLKSSVIHDSAFGGKFYSTNEGYIATSNVRLE